MPFEIQAEHLSEFKPGRFFMRSTIWIAASHKKEAFSYRHLARSAGLRAR